MTPTTVHPELPLEDEHLRATLAVLEQRRDEVGHYEAWGSILLRRRHAPPPPGASPPRPGRPWCGAGYVNSALIAKTVGQAEALAQALDVLPESSGPFQVASNADHPYSGGVLILPGAPGQGVGI